MWFLEKLILCRQEQSSSMGRRYFSVLRTYTQLAGNHQRHSPLHTISDKKMASCMTRRNLKPVPNRKALLLLDNVFRLSNNFLFGGFTYTTVSLMSKPGIGSKFIDVGFLFSVSIMSSNLCCRAHEPLIFTRARVTETKGVEGHHTTPSQFEWRRKY